MRAIHQKTGCFIFIPKTCPQGEDFRILEFSGSQQGVDECVREVETLVTNAQKTQIENSILQIYDPSILSSHNQYMLQQHQNTGGNTSINNNFSNTNLNSNSSINMISVQNQNSYRNAIFGNKNDVSTMYPQQTAYPTNGKININLINSNNLSLNNYSQTQTQVPYNNYTGGYYPTNYGMGMQMNNNYLGMNQLGTNQYMYNQNQMNMVNTGGNPNIYNGTQNKVEETNIITTTNISSTTKEEKPKKKDEKKPSSILNYIYGGQVK